MTGSPTKGPVLAVGGVIVGEGPTVCLIRRGHPPMAGRWSLPGGRVKAGESLEAALQRELLEETGLEVDVGELIEVVEILDEGHHYVVLDYRCRAVAGELRAGDDASEAVMAPVADLLDYELSDAVKRVVAEAIARV